MKKTDITDQSLKPIGVFDSGIGGLTVVKELTKILPNENIIYFGDTARVPYGNKSPGTVIRYSLEITNFLIKKNVKIIVIACNTASSISLEKIRKSVNIPVIGVIEPGAFCAVQASSNGKIGVIGTTATINSNSYLNAIKKFNPSLKIFQQACPLFVQLAEEGWTKNIIARLSAEKYIKPLRNKKIDTLILGCTHYPLLKEVISQATGKNVKLIDSGKETAKEVKKILSSKKILNPHLKKGRKEFFVSDLPFKFSEISTRFLKKQPDTVKLVKLEEIICLYDRKRNT